jgi:hypothetical protein
MRRASSMNMRGRAPRTACRSFYLYAKNAGAIDGGSCGVRSVRPACGWLGRHRLGRRPPAAPRVARTVPIQG